MCYPHDKSDYSSTRHDNGNKNSRDKRSIFQHFTQCSAACGYPLLCGGEIAQRKAGDSC
ncbi:hypothetical protein SerAS12_4656 [Serratia sp. AS12]|nr:hypothetical protein SerAS9_4655 [Serratia plymuthica AS9]AEF52701.1 hypothetical protein SerAS12_4656 [Serratia sp. AS12]AEG30408.1 hypothetical protein SerAS13_4656 [Serratia sp. AS13]